MDDTFEHCMPYLTGQGQCEEESTRYLRLCFKTRRLLGLPILAKTKYKAREHRTKENVVKYKSSPSKKSFVENEWL